MYVTTQRTDKRAKLVQLASVPFFVATIVLALRHYSSGVVVDCFLVGFVTYAAGRLIQWWLND